ncbi:HCN1 [Symbiodinium sp. CCMP2592]|nr:HCN1 [Symbiodinium sp. CCMP2592]
MKAGNSGSRSQTMRIFSSPTAMPVFEERKSRWILYPSSRCRLCWDALTLIILLQDMLVSPLHVFDVDAVQRRMQNSWILASDAFWSLDMVLSFFTATYVDGVLVQDRVGIAKAYARSWLPFDLCILIPDWLSVLLSDRGSLLHFLGLMRLVRAGRLLRLLRFLRLLRILKIKQAMQSFTLRGLLGGSWHFVVDVGKYVAGMVYGLHLLACFWYWVGNVPDGWVQEHEMSGQSLPSMYFASLTLSLSRLPASSMRWNMTLETDGERTLAIVATFLALGLSSVCISKVTNVMARLQSIRHQKNQIIRSLREYCASHGVDASHVLSMKKYAERELARKAANEAHTTLLETFSSSMLKTLLHQARKSFLCCHKEFASWCEKSEILEYSICGKAMTEKYVMRHDCIFMPSDRAEGMYLMATAECSYEFDSLPIMPRFGTKPESTSATRCCLWRFFSQPIAEIEENLTLLGAGDYISEHALWIAGWSHRGRLQATADGWVLVLPTCSLMETLKEHPGIVECVVSFARRYAAQVNILAEIDEDKLSDLPLCTQSEKTGSRSTRSGGRLRPPRRSVLPEPLSQ